jgi:hypothetical protein
VGKVGVEVVVLSRRRGSSQMSFIPEYIASFATKSKVRSILAYSLTCSMSGARATLSILPNPLFPISTIINH